MSSLARSLVAFGALSLADASSLSISPSLQVGFFEIGDDVGALNPHAYRPNEFVTNDFVFEGLVAWDPASDGADGVKGTSDDFIVGALAESWTEDASTNSITFKLRSGVTFHDGEPWDAATAALNFDHILGGPTRSWSGFHDWYGLGAAIKSWEAVDTLTFKMTFKYYYEAALRELSFIRPMRMTSPKALPSLEDGEISCAAWRRGAIRGTFDGKYTCRGVKAPIGTGPYKVVDKLLKKGLAVSRRMPAVDFNETCYNAGGCIYETGEYVSEVLFHKHGGYVGNRKSPSFDEIIVRAYGSTGDIKAALINGTLDIAYGPNTLPQAAFVSLATDEGAAAGLTAHESTIDINTRLLVLNSAGVLNTPDLRKMVMSKIDRDAMLVSELAEETPADQLFDPAQPYCDVGLKPMKKIFGDTKASSTDIAFADGTEPTRLGAELASGDLNADGKALRFIYMKDIPHHQMIASKVTADLYTAGIPVKPIPLEKSAYNAAMNSWLGPNYDGVAGDISFDIAISETWGPSYDPSSKLFDMTYEWGSGEADTIATNNLKSMTKADLTTKIRGVSKEKDKTKREKIYKDILTTLHNEAVFLPLSHKRHIAVVGNGVNGFAFGGTEYDIPVSAMSPNLWRLPAWATAVVIAGILGVLLLGFIGFIISKEKKGTPIFTPLEKVGTKTANANSAA